MVYQKVSFGGLECLFRMATCPNGCYMAMLLPMLMLMLMLAACSTAPTFRGEGIGYDRSNAQQQARADLSNQVLVRVSATTVGRDSRRNGQVQSSFDELRRTTTDLRFIGQRPRCQAEGEGYRCHLDLATRDRDRYRRAALALYAEIQRQMAAYGWQGDGDRCAYLATLLDDLRQYAEYRAILWALDDPAELPMLPKSLAEVRQQRDAQDPPCATSPAAGPLRIEARSSAGIHPILRQGDTFYLEVRLNQPGYIYVLGAIEDQAATQAYLLELRPGEDENRFYQYIDATRVGQWVPLGHVMTVEPPFGRETFYFKVSAARPELPKTFSRPGLYGYYVDPAVLGRRPRPKIPRPTDTAVDAVTLTITTRR